MSDVRSDDRVLAALTVFGGFIMLVICCAILTIFVPFILFGPEPINLWIAFSVFVVTVGVAVWRGVPAIALTLGGFMVLGSAAMAGLTASLIWLWPEALELWIVFFVLVGMVVWGVLEIRGDMRHVDENSSD